MAIYLNNETYVPYKDGVACLPMSDTPSLEEIDNQLDEYLISTKGATSYNNGNLEMNFTPLTNQLVIDRVNQKHIFARVARYQRRNHYTKKGYTPYTRPARYNECYHPGLDEWALVIPDPAGLKSDFIIEVTGNDLACGHVKFINFIDIDATLMHRPFYNQGQQYKIIMSRQENYFDNIMDSTSVELPANSKAKEPSRAEI